MAAAWRNGAAWRDGAARRGGSALALTLLVRENLVCLANLLKLLFRRIRLLGVSVRVPAKRELSGEKVGKRKGECENRANAREQTLARARAARQRAGTATAT